VVIYGVRMIAPAPESECCGGSESRSARSGLIRGLLGEAPFDGSQFPPLPWGGKRIADADIQFIADWIEAGGPETDDGVQTCVLSPSAADGQRKQRIAVSDIVEFKVMEGPGWLALRRGVPRQRPNLDCMSDTQLDGLRRAFRTMFDLDKKIEDRRN